MNTMPTTETTETTPRPRRASRVARRDEQLRAADFALLARPFAAAIAFLFPEGLALDFVENDTTEPEPDGDIHYILAPLELDDGSGITLRLATADAAQAAALSDEWLAEQLPRALQVLRLARPGFLDGDTGFYHSRALRHALEPGRGVFFLIQTGCLKKNLDDTLQCCAETARALRRHAEEALFACGYGLFALLSDNPDMAAACRRGRALQRRLKQEGLRRGQILYMAAARADAILTDSGLAGFQESLSGVDKQGPFGLLCRASGMNERRTLRFRLKNDAVFHELERKWQAHRAFSLAVFRLEDPDAVFGEAAPGLLGPEKQGELWLDDDKTLVCFFGDLTPEETAEAAPRLRERLVRMLSESGAAEPAELDMAIGIAGWPCLDYTKKYVPANCFKALMHASFLGPGRQVIFDHISLNVSGDSFYEEGNHVQAIQEYRRGLRLNPGDVNLLNSLGVTLAANGQENQAIQCFRQALDLDPANYMALANLGYILLSRGKTDEALKRLTEARDAFPAGELLPWELLKPLVQLHLDRAQHNEAQAVLVQWAASADVADDALYHRQLGLALEGTGQRDEALRAFEQALKLDPQDAIAMGHLGGLYRECGEGPELGLRLCRQAVRLKRDRADLWRVLAREYLAGGNLDAADDALQQCLRLDREDAEAMWLAARICLEKKNARQARNWLNRAVKLHTISGALQERIARTLAELAGDAAGGKKKHSGKTDR